MTDRLAPQTGAIVRTIHPLPPWVVVVRTLFSGATERERMPADKAVADLWLNARNGVDIYSARIEWGTELDCWSFSGHFPPNSWAEPGRGESPVGRLSGPDGGTDTEAHDDDRPAGPEYPV